MFMTVQSTESGSASYSDFTTQNQTEISLISSHANMKNFNSFFMRAT